MKFEAFLQKTHLWTTLLQIENVLIAFEHAFEYRVVLDCDFNKMSYQEFGKLQSPTTIR